MALNDPAITCGTDFSLEELFLAAIDTDASGRPTLRIIDSNGTNVNFVECGSFETFDSIARQLFALDSNGKVAIRLSLP